MKRRSFLASCTVAATAAAGGSTLLKGALVQAASTKGAFADAPIRLSVSPGWFKGPIDQQLEAIAECGIPGYETLNPGGDLDAMAAKAKSLGLELSCITGAGAIAPGGMVQPADHDKVVAQFKEHVAMAKKLGCKHVIGLTGNRRDDVSDEEQTKYIIECAKRLAPIAEENDLVLCMEALNVLVDHKGYFLVRTDQTMAILKAINSPNVKMCFDIYHQQISEGNVIRNLTENIERIGHFHVGDNPGRKEPGTGELNYKNIFKAIYEEGYAKKRYDGFVALECGHSKSTEEALNSVLDCLKWS